MAYYPFRLARSTSARLATYAGQSGELLFDVDKQTLCLQNGSTGGIYLATTATATQSVAGLMSAADKTKLDNLSTASAGGSTVSFTRSQTSGTKLGTLTIDGTATDLYAPSAASYSAGTGLSLSGTAFSLDTSGVSAGEYGPNAATYMAETTVSASHESGFCVPDITVDDYGRVTACENIAIDLSGTNVYIDYTGGLSSSGSDTVKLGTIKQGTSVTEWPIYAPAVSVTRSLTSGTKIGTITVGNTATDLYAPTAVSYSAGTGLSLSSATFSLATSGVSAGSYGPNANASPALGGTFSVPYVTVDAYGRVTSASTKTITLPSSAGGSEVSFTRSLTSGTKIGTITIDGTSTDLYCSTNTDTNTTYTAGTGLSLSGTKFSLATSGVSASSYGPSANASPSNGGSFSVPYITVDTYGRITSASTKTITLPTISTSSSSDVNMTQTATTTSSNYPVLFKYTTATSTVTAGARFGSTILANPSTGIVYANNLCVYNTALSAHTATNGTAISHLYFSSTKKETSDLATWAACRAGHSTTANSIGLNVYNHYASNSAVVELVSTASNNGTLQAYTTAGASSTPNKGVISLGNSSFKWTQLFATTATISTSDAREKQQIAAITDELLDAWGDIAWKTFKFNDAVEEKGADVARTHSGAIAQEIEAVFTAHGLDASKYGFFCHDIIEAFEGDGVRPPVEAGDPYSLRYEEALCIEAAYQRRRADRLEARLEALEARLAALEG